ncbi:MAG: tetratricopeptide repeat protein [Planctomycetes bacterium]|nr:tetratricopeptide repeat protein [Planctomycetota bacterium]MBL7146106.1 tetratricopeptide repeat protein [Phycisphaerae bacterium]
MNAKKHRIIAVLLLVMIPTRIVFAQSVEDLVRQGNKKYAEGNFNEAINEYDQALVDKPEALRPKFNKANSYYRLDDLAKAMDLYEEVAAKARDMDLVVKAKYNTGNCYFQRGSKQKDSDLNKALDDMNTSITFWRQVLDIEPDNKKAARNIEVARPIIKNIIDQLNKQKQQQDPNRPQDPNQPQQQQNTPEQDQMNQQQDPNQPQEQNQGQDPNKPDDKQQDAQQQQQKKEQKAVTPDATAQEILDKEQNQKEQRQILQRGRYQRVEKDW